MEIIDVDTIDADDPHGYCPPPSVDTTETFYIPWKRINLGKEIRELHILNEARVIPPSPTGYFSKELSCKLIDDILDVQKPKRSKVERVKRQLFRKSRDTPRKAENPKKSKQELSSAYKFRCIRSEVGYRKIKKNYLDEARIKVAAEINREKLGKRRPSSSSANFSGAPDSKKERSSPEWPEDPSRMLHVRTDDGVFPVSPNTLTEICKFHERMVRKHPSKIRTEYEQFKRNLNTEACRLSRRVTKLAGLILEEQYRERVSTNTKIIEESIRSIHYLKTLYAILMENEYHIT